MGIAYIFSIRNFKTTYCFQLYTLKTLFILENVYVDYFILFIRRYKHLSQ
jgi:hypothetical protein